jgi:hypothetical protein
LQIDGERAEGASLEQLVWRGQRVRHVRHDYWRFSFWCWLVSAHWLSQNLMTEGGSLMRLSSAERVSAWGQRHFENQG